MKTSWSVLTALSLFLLSACTPQPSEISSALAQIENDLNSGELKKATLLVDSLKKHYPRASRLVYKADSLVQIAERIAVDFSLTEDQISSRLSKNMGNYTAEDKASWEKTGWLEWRMIDGEKRYFNRAASNLLLIRSFHDKRTERDSLIARDSAILFRKRHTESIIKASENKTESSVPVEMTIYYTITVKPDVIPSGETVRCWLPYPKESHPRQSGVYLLAVSNEDFYLSPDTMTHRTLYMENKAEKGLPVVFGIAYRYKSSGQYFDPVNNKILPYNRNSELYRKYTSEQLPQICFTQNVKHLADSITGPEENPREIVKKIYYWFDRNIPWAGALEYSIMPNIPEYVIKHRRGDCGMQTFLFMSMLRYKGIPVKWQSGWMVPPDEKHLHESVVPPDDKNLHDWCEVYYEGFGWIPVDVSYGLQYSTDQKTREFYISGIDSYRLIVNDGISGDLYPEKKFLRSEPFDFQRGEVEWKGGNLYFDKWDYEMRIEYKK
jgi:transglutaminase-like putative cysteine protease